MKKYGLIGYPLGHSFSVGYFNEKFRREFIPGCSYVNFEIASISLFPEILKDPELLGLNVTIPYKESIVPFLHTKDPVVEQTGACNCILISQGILSGFNTDVIGFENSLEQKLTGKDKRALILGTGGSSKAVAWVLKKKGIDILWVSRKKTLATGHVTYENLDQKLMQTHSLIINCTPLGMYPNEGGCPPLPYEFVDSRHYLFDLVYNPDKTLFLAKGESAGARTKNGADMLTIQAEASWTIWNSESAG
jgi:shikimate dehydrogenase